MTDETLEQYIERLSKIMDGTIMTTIIYNPKNEKQKLFIVKCEALHG